MTKADHIAGVVAEKDAEIARLNELLRSEGANRYWEGRWRDADADCEALKAELQVCGVREVELEDALEQSVALQSHYAHLLNMFDAGKRIEFKNADEWLARLRIAIEATSSAGAYPAPPGSPERG